MDERVMPGPKPARDDASVQTYDEDWPRGTYGPWFLSGSLQGPFGGPFIQGGEDVKGPQYVV